MGSNQGSHQGSNQRLTATVVGAELESMIADGQLYREARAIKALAVAPDLKTIRAG